MTSKRVLLGFLSLLLLISGVFAVLPATARADEAPSVEELLAQIQSLLVQIQALKAELVAQGGEAPSEFCHDFTQGVGLGVRENSEDDVNALRIIFGREGISIPEQAYFDEDFAASVIEFQQKYGIRRTGYVGPKTRAQLNALYGCGRTEHQAPVIPPVPTTSTQPPITASNVLASIGTPIVDGRGLVIGYNYDMSLTLFNRGNSDVFLSNMGRGTDITAVINPDAFYVNYSRNASPISLSGDVSGTSLIIPAGSSRSLNFSGQLLSQGQTGQVSYRITSFVYGTSGYTPSGFSLTSGLDNLMVTATFSGSINTAPTTSTQPSITSISGPTQLNDGESGTWNVNAQDSGGSKLSYGVIWGDEPEYKNIYGGMPLLAIQYQNIPVFTHRYFKVASTGTTWTPAFFVKNAQGQETRKGLAVNVGFTSTQPSVSVLSPNGGENWQPGGTYTISYRLPSTDDSALVYLENYHPAGSAKAGQSNSSTLIAQPDRGVQSVSFTVPSSFTSLPGYQNSYKIKVCTTWDNCGTPSKIDSSDGYFSIGTTTSTQPSITVLSPSGGGIYKSGDLLSVQWLTASRFSSVAIYLVSQNGELYSKESWGVVPDRNNPIADTTMTLRFVFSSDVPPGLYKVRAYLFPEGDMLRKIGTALASAESSGYFTITAPTTSTQPSITVLSPNGNENLPAGSSQTIQWTSQNVNKVSIWLCNSGVCSRMPDIPATGISNTGSYNWTVPVSGTTIAVYKIRVASEDQYPTSTVYDDSNIPFSIAPASTPSVTLISPNGGETFSRNDTIPVRWSMSASSGVRGIDLTNIDTNTGTLVYRVQNGQTDQGLTSGTYNIDLSSISWVTPGRYKVSVLTTFGGSGNDTYDSSNSFFTITAPSTSANQSSGASVSVNGSPTLELTYDTAGKEALLSATFNVSVTAGSSDLSLYTGSMADVSLSDQNNKLTGPNSMRVVVTVPRVEKSDVYGRNYGIVAAGQTVPTTVILTVNPKELFAGAYRVRLNNLYTLGSDPGNVGHISVSSYTNAKTIVGEVSPYITSVTNPATVGQTFTISGARLADSQVFINNSLVSNVTIATAPDGSSMWFALPSISAGSSSMSAGSYPVYVVDRHLGSVAGKSNIVWVQVGGQTSTQPSITVLSPNGINWPTGSVQRIQWSVNNTNFDRIQLIVGSPTSNMERTLYDRVSSIDYLPNTATYFDWNVPASILTDLNSTSFYIKVNAVKSDTAGYQIIASAKSSPFTIAAPTTSTQPSITSIDPTSASEKTTVTIYGRNFKSTAAAFFNQPTGAAIRAASVSPDGSVLIFAIPVAFTPGTYSVTVANNDGTPFSNAVNFTVTAPTTTVPQTLTLSVAPSSVNAANAGTASVDLLDVDLSVNVGSTLVSNISATDVSPNNKTNLTNLWISGSNTAGAKITGATRAIPLNNATYPNAMQYDFVFPNAITVVSGQTLHLHVMGDVTSNATDYTQFQLGGVGYNDSSLKVSGIGTYGNRISITAPTVASSASASLLSTFTDRAGVWDNFGPGPGNANSTSADWNWTLSLAVSDVHPNIASITVKHDNGYEGWSTSDDPTPFGKKPYPLVVLDRFGTPLNNGYNQIITLTQGGGTYVFNLFGQVESTTFSGATVTMKFTDGTLASTHIPASSITPPAATATVSKPLACGSIGDVNGDGVISSSDKDLVSNYIVGNTTFTTTQKTNADVSGDGMVSSADVSYLNGYLTGSQSTFPACSTSGTTSPPPSITVSSETSQLFFGYPLYTFRVTNQNTVKDITLQQVSFSVRMSDVSVSGFTLYGDGVAATSQPVNASGGVLTFSLDPASAAGIVGAGSTKVYELKASTIQLGRTQTFETLTIGLQSVLSGPKSVLNADFLLPAGTTFPSRTLSRDCDCVLPTTSTQPSITVLYPNGGETFKQGDPITARWTSSGLASTESLVVSAVSSGGTSWNFTFPSDTTPNDGSQAMGASLPADTYRLTIRNLSGTVSGSSNGTFTVTATTSPTASLSNSQLEQTASALEAVNTLLQAIRASLGR